MDIILKLILNLSFNSLVHYEFASKLLHENACEELYPNIYRALLQKADAHIIRELVSNVIGKCE